MPSTIPFRRMESVPSEQPTLREIALEAAYDVLREELRGNVNDTRLRGVASRIATRIQRIHCGAEPMPRGGR